MITKPGLSSELCLVPGIFQVNHYTFFCTINKQCNSIIIERHINSLLESSMKPTQNQTTAKHKPYSQNYFYIKCTTHRRVKDRERKKN